MQPVNWHSSQNLKQLTLPGAENKRGNKNPGVKPETEQQKDPIAVLAPISLTEVVIMIKKRGRQALRRI